MNPWAIAGGVGGGILSGIMGNSAAKKAYKQQMALLNKAEGKMKGGASESKALWGVLLQQLMPQLQRLADESKALGEEQKRIGGGQISAANRLASEGVTNAAASSVQNNMNLGNSNTTASQNATNFALRQAAAGGGQLQMNAGNIMSSILGQSFDRTAGIMGQKFGMQANIQGQQAQIPMQLGQALGSLWGNVQVQPAQTPDLTSIGYLMAQGE